MPLQIPRLPRSLLYPRPIVFDGFRGLNLIDDPTQLSPQYSPYFQNFLCSSQGQMVKRPGWVRAVTGGNLPGAVASTKPMVFYWAAQNKLLLQDGLSLYAGTYPAAASLIATFSTTDTAAAVEFNGKVAVVHPVDGVFDWDGTTWTLRNATVKGTCIAAWQNKLWVGGDTTNRSRVWASNAGSSATWTTASDFVDLRELNDDIVTAIGAGSGMDIAGRPGLMVFKQSSWYRINSSNATTGFTYTTLHDRAGAVGPNAVASTQTHLAAVSYDGIYVSDGVNAPVKASRIIDPVFKSGWTSSSSVRSNVTAVVREGVFVFSNLPASSVVSFDPLLDTWAFEGYPLIAATIYRSPTTGLQAPIGVSANGDVVQAEPLNASATYTDYNAAAYTSYWMSPWIEPFAGRNSRLQTVRVRGNNAAVISLQTQKDLLATTTVYTLPVNAVDATHESFVATQHDLGAANLWRLNLACAGSTATAYTDTFRSASLTTPPPVQISQIAATFYLLGLSS